MRLLERVLTPRGKPSARPDLPVLALPSQGNHQLESPSQAAADENSRPTSRLGRLKSLLTPRGRSGRPSSGSGGDAALEAALISARTCSPRPMSDAQRTQAYRPALASLIDSQLRLSESPAPSSVGRRPLLAAVPAAAAAEDDDTSSEADSDLSSLDGFGDYARQLSPQPLGGQENEGCGSNRSSPACPDSLPSPRQLTARMHKCTPQQSARDTQKAAEDLQRFLQGELPTSLHRLARLLVHADSVGADAFADVPLHCLGYERCAELLLQVLVPLPLATRSGALAQLQSKLSAQLLSYLGTSLERVLESERGCQRFCRLPFEVAKWLLEHGPCERGETLFDLANLWLEQRQRQGQGPASAVQQASLAALIWRRPLAADFLSCMEANLPWAADYVARCQLRPAHLPASLDGRFSFTAEFELHDLLELQQAAVASGRPQQQQSPAMYCGGFAWWAMLVANPQQNRFELYVSCSAFSLFLEPFRSALQPAADVRFTFQGNTSLVDWRQSNEERVGACHTHWGGPSFWVHPTCPCLLPSAGGSGGSEVNRSPSGGVGSMGGRPPLAPIAASARPDTARGARPSASRQASRLSNTSSKSGDLAAALASSGSLGAVTPSGTRSGALPTPRSGSSMGSGQRQQQLLRGGSSISQGGGGYEADSGAITARHLRPSVEGLCQLSMEQLVSEVRRSCPYTWGASLRVRLNIRLLGGSMAGSR